MNFSQLHGEGVLTGARYVSQEAVNFSVHLTELGQSTTLTDHFTLTGQGGVPNEVLQARFHITRNANGTVTSFADEFRVKCTTT